MPVLRHEGMHGGFERRRCSPYRTARPNVSKKRRFPEAIGARRSRPRARADQLFDFELGRLALQALNDINMRQTVNNLLYCDVATRTLLLLDLPSAGSSSHASPRTASSQDGDVHQLPDPGGAMQVCNVYNCRISLSVCPTCSRSVVRWSRPMEEPLPLQVHLLRLLAVSFNSMPARAFLPVLAPYFSTQLTRRLRAKLARRSPASVLVRD